MSPQEYFEILIEDCDKKMTVSEKAQKEHPGLFTEISNIQEIKEEEYTQIFEISAFVNDAKTSFQKIAIFLFFMEKLGIEIDTSSTNNIKGLIEFISEYKPFDFRTVENVDGITELKNDETNAEVYKNFKQNFKTMLNLKSD